MRFQKGQVPWNKNLTKESFKKLPKYIAYRAALLREKLILSYLIAIISGLFVIHFTISRIEIASLYKQLRLKEYILAPGVLDFTTATFDLMSIRDRTRRKLDSTTVASQLNRSDRSRKIQEKQL